MTLESSMAGLPRVVVRRRSARPFFARHPWVFDTSIQRVERDPPAGAEVWSAEGKFVARGLYNPGSTIR
ncbi:MAG TPA: class I SAM-dependent rRNA methyltransferase, partial [Isosphaeraceae bacterium]